MDSNFRKAESNGQSPVENHPAVNQESGSCVGIYMHQQPSTRRGEALALS
ncbi:MAG: hypothetical protein ACI3V5_06800 [Faecousia sp.]